MPQCKQSHRLVSLSQFQLNLLCISFESAKFQALHIPDVASNLSTHGLSLALPALGFIRVFWFIVTCIAVSVTAALVMVDMQTSKVYTAVKVLFTICALQQTDAI